MIDTRPHDRDTTIMGPGFFVFFQRGITETGGWGYKDHPWLRAPREPERYEAKEKKAIEIVEELVEKVMKKPSKVFEEPTDQDLELMLRLQLEHQEITFKFIYLIWLQDCYRMRQNEEDALFLLLLH